MIFGEPEPGEANQKSNRLVDFQFALGIVTRMGQDRLRAWVLALERGPSGNANPSNTPMYARDTLGRT